MTRTPVRPGTRRRKRRSDGKTRLAEVERELAAVLARLTAGLQRPAPLGLELLLERALRDAERSTRGAGDAHDGETRWTALFNRLLAARGTPLGQALLCHHEVRISDGNAAASVLVHAMEGLVRRSAELPNARARAAARSEVIRMLKVFLCMQ